MRARRTTLLVLAAVLAVISSSPMARAEPVAVKYSWTAPTVGSEPVAYLVEYRFKGEAQTSWGPWGEMRQTPELSVVLDLQPENCYQVRVRALDAAGIRGPYSPESEPYCVPAGSEGEVETNNLGPLPIGGGKPKGPEPVPD